MKQISGCYKIYNTEGKLIAVAPNIITNHGREVLSKGFTRRNTYLAFSRDISPPSKNRIFLPHRNRIPMIDIPKQTPTALGLKTTENFFLDLKNGFVKTGTKLTFRGRIIDSSPCKIAFFVDNKLFSEALILDSKGNIIHLDPGSSDLLIVYELAVLHNTNPVIHKTKTKTFTLTWDDSLDSKLFDCFTKFDLVKDRLDPLFNYVFTKESDEVFTIYIEAKGPLREVKNSLIIPTTKGTYILSTEEGFPLEGEEFSFTIEFKLRYD